MGDGSVADMLWARPSATVLGIDVPHVIGSSAAIQASAAARVSLRIPNGVGGQDAQDALVEHLRSRVPWGLHCTIERVAVGDPFAGSLSGPGYESLKAGDGGGLRPRADDRGPGRVDPALQRVRRDLPGRGDHADGRRGAEVPDPRAERERGSVRDRAHRAGRGAVPRAATRRRRDDPAAFTAQDFAQRMARAVEQAAGRGPRRRADHARPRPRLLHGLPADGDHRADHAAGRAARPRPGDDPADPRAPGRRGGAGRLRGDADATGPTATIRTPRRPRCSSRTGATRSRTRRGRCTCSRCRRRCPAPATSR